VIATFLAALSRGGLMFMLIIWLQGIWLPLHGYSFASTPLWAGIAMVPLTAGMLIAGPISGMLSDRYGARPFASGGMIGVAICFALFELLPIDFNYWVFGSLLFVTGLAEGTFGSPNRTGIMNSLPPEHRGAGAGMNVTFQNSAGVVSIGIFFSLMIIGLASSLPHNVLSGLLGHGVPPDAAEQAAHLPPISTLFAAFLGYDPVQHLVGAGTMTHLNAAQQSALGQRTFFPSLISAPFQAGLHAAFDFAIVVSLIGAAASWTRGGRYVYGDSGSADEDGQRPAEAEGVLITGEAMLGE
jgi:MFS family permease